jgi:hypothetical protein
MTVFTIPGMLASALTGGNHMGVIQYWAFFNFIKKCRKIAKEKRMMSEDGTMNKCS